MTLVPSMPTLIGIVCGLCSDVVSSTERSPRAVNRSCRCGQTTPATWQGTTRRLNGFECGACHADLFYDGPIPGVREFMCDGGAHLPKPAAKLTAADVL